MNIFVISKVATKIRYKVFLFGSLVIGLISIAGVIIFSTSIFFFLFIGLFVISYSLYRPICQSQLLSGNDHISGSIIGLVTTINSIGMMAGGFLGGILFSMESSLPFFVIAGLLTFAIIISSFRRIRDI